MILNKRPLLWPWQCIALIAFIQWPPKISAQSKLPVMNATTSEIVIKFNDALITSWHLEPQKKPDVFQIGSTLKAKKIRFVSDVDSMEFDIRGGQNTDFIILLNGKEACWTRIDALDDPMFLHKSIAIPVCIVVFLLFLFTFLRWHTLPVRSLLFLGLIIPCLFWSVTIIAGILHKNYDHLKMTISELGAIGTGSEIFSSISLFTISILSIFFSIGFYNASKELHINKVPAILSLSMPVAMGWAAVFSLGHEMHSALGPLPMVMMIGMVVALIFWRGEKYKTLRMVSGISICIILLFLMRFKPGLLINYEGLLQRLFYLGWSVWFIGLSVYIRKMIK